MKKPEQQILQILSAFRPSDVKKGIKLWATGFVHERRREMEAELRKLGWKKVDYPPPNKEYLKVRGEYWIQDKEAHMKQVREALEERRKEKTVNYPESQAQEQEGSTEETELYCPVCTGKMYKERICPSCEEGKKGYRIRLICEENTDHSILL